ncbi:MAG: GNAT family N-acetyltransferase [Gammaproteobacteria bacterium]
MNSHVHGSIESIPAAAWNALAGTTAPCLRHEYFAALEASGSIGSGSGWTPRYLTLETDAGGLRAAVPLYEKSDSRGEFIFDWDWAAALERSGRHYYPKLVAAIPFTPVPGPRILLAADAGINEARTLADAALELAGERNASSLHWLFVPERELAPLEASGCLARTGCHFEWHNRGVDDFDAWLATLTSARRKNIRRERRRVREAGIKCEWRDGGDLDADELALVYRLYAANYYVHGMMPYLGPQFFHELARCMPESFAVCLAYRGAEIVAGAFYLQDAQTLYGRYWGAFEWIDCLHFEVCYYQGIAYAIENRLKRFHPGVQGEQKLLRGFEPTTHYSAHWLRDTDLRRAVASFLERERSAVSDYAEEAAEFLPFHRDKG